MYELGDNGWGWNLNVADLQCKCGAFGPATHICTSCCSPLSGSSQSLNTLSYQRKGNKVICKGEYLFDSESFHVFAVHADRLVSRSAWDTHMEGLNGSARSLTLIRNWSLACWSWEGWSWTWLQQCQCQQWQKLQALSGQWQNRLMPFWWENRKKLVDKRFFFWSISSECTTTGFAHHCFALDGFIRLTLFTD